MYLTGSVPRPLAMVQRVAATGQVGLLVIPRPGSTVQCWIPHFPFWGADTGLFGQKFGARIYTLDRYLSSLDKCERQSCLFATAPDVFGDGAATLRMSLDVLPQIRALGFPAAFVAQPGVPEYPWDEFDCLFMGGHDEFKQTEGPKLLAEAKAQGKWCHIGRVNSTKRYLWAREQGYDSADGTHIAFCPTKNVKRVLSWVTSARQLTLEEIA